MSRRLFSSVIILLFSVLTANAVIAQDDPSTPKMGEAPTAAPGKSKLPKPKPLKIGSPAPALNIEH